MLIILLVGALIAQTGLAAPSSNCAELCDDQGSGGSYGHSKSSSSYSSYSKSNYGQGIQGVQGLPGSPGSLGSTGGRLENLDENVIGTSGLDRPGNWQDEKHYITNDGRGQMSYRAGQSVSNNGYSKYAQHSYSYGSHESHAPLSNSQVLTPEEFGHELQNMRNRISSFMGNFHVDGGSNVNANLLQDFKTKASLISNQMSNVCNQMDTGSSMYQQMQVMMNQFQRDVDQRQREMESIMYQNSGSSTTAAIHGSPYRFPTIPSAHYDEQFSKVQTLISSFYTNFNRPDTNLQFQQDLNAQVDVINSKLADLNYESVQNESERKRIEHLKKQFETYVSQIRTRIHEIEQRNQEEEAKRKDRELQLKLEKQQQEEKLRQEELLRQQQQEEERIRLQQQEEERIRLQQQEDERLRLQQQQQEEERVRLQQQEEERLRLQQKQEEENKRIRQEHEERSRIALLQQQQQQSKVKISGSSTYEHSMMGSYGAPSQGSSTGYTESYSYGTHTKPQPVIQPHVDLTAAMSRLQQDLNRLQTEVNNFNTYKMRLTSANSVTIVGEAERHAEQLRERINNLCETSNRYQNHNIQTSAENLGRRFEELFRSFQNQAANFSAQGSSAYSAGYASESSYGSTGHYGTVHSPSISNLEYEHSKSVDVEIGRRPAASQGYSSGSAYSSTNSYGAHGADGQFRNGLIDLGASGSRQVDCVEMYADQPCIEQPRRHRRFLGAQKYDSLSDSQQQQQQQQQIFTDLSQHDESVQLQQESKPIRNKIFNQQIQRPTKPNIHNLLRGHQIEDLTQQEGDFDDFFTHQNQNNQKHVPISSSNSEFQQKTEDLSQQNINSELAEELEDLQKSQNKNANVTPHPHDQQKQNIFENKFSDQQKIVDITTKLPHVKPITYGKAKVEEEKFTSENQHLIQSTDKIKEFMQNSQNFTLQTSGFGDYFSQYKPKVFDGSHSLQETQQTINQLHQNPESQLTDTQNHEFNHQNNHRTGQHIDVLSQQQQDSSNQVVDSYQSNQQLQNIDSEIILNTTVKSQLTPIVHPTVKPLIKPVSRYARPWQVSHTDNVPHQTHDNPQQSEHEHHDSMQQHQQVNLFENSGLFDSQKSEKYVEQPHHSTSNNFNKENEAVHQSNKNQENDYQNLQQQQESNQGIINPKLFEQKELNQQIQDTSFQQQSSLLELDQQQTISQKSKGDLTEEQMSINKKRPINTELKTESTTISPTFWNRVGHKITDSFDKVKEKAKNIFG